MEAMEEEWMKPNTDCVYFLASPLTCKKGIECEYRHSEIARLNPRDCRYWMAGNCPSPNCAFRHPPLDVPTDGSLECVNTTHQYAASLKKTNVPCYFFFNGFCSKGERCAFLHGPSDNANKESTKTVSAFVDRPGIEKIIAITSDNVSSAPIVTHAKPAESSPHSRAGFEVKSGVDIQQKSPERVDIQQKSPENVSLQTAAKRFSESLLEEDTTCRMNSSLPTKEFLQGTSHASTDLSSDDQVENHTEQEDCLESSPGFDVLVDDMEEDLGYEEDPKGFLCEDGEGNGLSMQHMGYHCEDVGFDILYPDEKLLFEHEGYRSCDHSDIDIPFICAKEIPYHVKERGLELRLSQKRKFVQASQAFGCMDLRDLLKNRRSINDHNQDCFSRTLKSYQTEERYRQPVLKRLRGRLASKVVSNGIGSQIENENFPKSSNHQNKLGNSRVSRSWQHFKERRQSKQQHKTDGFRKESSRKRQSSEESMIFTGPKSLGQIREEKRKPKEIMNSCERIEPSRGTAVEEFQSPKSLTEILKEKRMLRSVVGDINQ